MDPTILSSASGTATNSAVVKRQRQVRLAERNRDFRDVPARDIKLAGQNHDRQPTWRYKGIRSHHPGRLHYPSALPHNPVRWWKRRPPPAPRHSNAIPDEIHSARRYERPGHRRPRQAPPPPAPSFPGRGELVPSIEPCDHLGLAFRPQAAPPSSAEHSFNVHEGTRGPSCEHQADLLWAMDSPPAKWSGSPTASPARP